MKDILARILFAAAGLTSVGTALYGAIYLQANLGIPSGGHGVVLLLAGFVGIACTAFGSLLYESSRDHTTDIEWEKIDRA